MNRFTFTVMVYPPDRVLTSYLMQAMDSGIKIANGVDGRGAYLEIAFLDGSSIIAWNVNRYYAWLSRGVFTFPDKSMRGYKWDDSRPSKSAMARLYKMLKHISY